MSEEFSFVFAVGRDDDGCMLARSPQAALQRLFDEVGTVDQIGIDDAGDGERRATQDEIGQVPHLFATDEPDHFRCRDRRFF